MLSGVTQRRTFVLPERGEKSFFTENGTHNLLRLQSNACARSTSVTTDLLNYSNFILNYYKIKKPLPTIKYDYCILQHQLYDNIKGS